MAESERTRIDPNTADVETLCRLPGIGPAMAQRIVAARPFDSVEDLTRVRGISNNSVQRMSAWLSLMPIQTEPAVAKVEGEPMSIIPADLIEEEIVAPEPPAADIDLVEEEGATPETLSGADLVEEDVPFEAIGGVDLVEEEGAASSTVADTDLVEAKVDLADSFEAEGDEAEAVSTAEPPTASPVSPEPAPIEPAPARRATITRARLLWTVAIGSLFALLLSMVLSLGILANLNNSTLRFALPSEMGALTVRVEGLEAQADDLSQDVDGLRTRLNNLEALNGRVSTLEESAQQLRQDVDATNAEVSEVSTQVGDLTAQLGDLTGEVADLTQQADKLEAELETVQRQNAQFQAFFEGLRDLMVTLFESEGDTP